MPLLPTQFPLPACLSPLPAHRERRASLSLAPLHPSALGGAKGLAWSFYGACILFLATAFVSMVSAPLAHGGPEPSSQQSSVPFQSLEVKGNKRIEAATIQNYLKLNKGDPLSQHNLNDGLKALLKTGLFSSASIKQEGSTVFVTVEENPVVNRVAFEGNSKLSDDAIRKEIKLPPRTPYNPAEIQQLQQKLLAMYRLSGRYKAKVEPKIIKQPENRVDVVFEIDEGPSTYVERIVFQGNKRFSQSTLASVILTKESRWYRFMTNDDTYDTDRMAYDQTLLKQFYLDNGYADFKISSALAELSPDKKDFFITYVVDEGARYRVGEIRVDNPYKDIPTALFEDVIPFQSGQWYNASAVDDAVEAMSRVAGDRGYAFVDPEPSIDLDPAAKTVAITFKIKEGPKVFVERIEIEGNTRTRDEVIRREFRLAEGDPFNVTRLKRTEQRLRNLGFFKSVKITPRIGSSPDKIILKTVVEEQVTGQIQFGVGYGTQSGFLADVTVSEKNLLGKGQETSLRLLWGKRQEGVDFSFMEPFFMHRRLSAGFNIFGFRVREKENGIKDVTVGVRPWIGYEINEHLSQQVYYGLKRSDISFSPHASPFISSQPRRSVNSSLGLVTSYDKRDSSIEPHDGYILTMGNDFTGVGGNARYVKNTLSGSQYFPVTKETTLALRAEGGVITPLGNKFVRTLDRFELGGFSLRGFDFGGVGPRDIRGEMDALGGLRYYVTTLEMLFPVGLPKEFAVMGSAFVEGGSLWKAQQRDPNLYDQNLFRYSAGVGLSWTSPMGPIRVDYAIPMKKGKFDKTRQFLFGFTSRF